MIRKIVEYFIELWYSIFRLNVNDGVIIMKGNKLTVFDVANYFRSKESMSHKKLQKLVYYSYAWYIALNNDSKDDINNKLFDDCFFEAWVHGPVCRPLYNLYSDNYGFVNKHHGKVNNLICGELKKFLDSVYKTFGKYTGDELETISHLETPWKNARGSLTPSEPSGKALLESDMFVYYNNL